MDQNNKLSDRYQYSTFNQQPHTYSEQYQHPYPVQPPKTNGKAITALVLGILALCIPYVGFILGIVAIVIASMAFKELKRTHEQGRGLAIAGLVCGIIGTVIYGIIIFIIIIAAVIFATAPDPSYMNF